MPPTNLLAKPLLLTTLAIPVTAFLLALPTYLYSQALPLPSSRLLKTTDTLTPSSARSKAVHIVNRQNHVAMTDSISIFLSTEEVGRASDEVILSRFLYGFFGGWTFVPERLLLGALGVCGIRFAETRFAGINLKAHNTSLSVSELSTKSLPTVHTRLFDSNFVILDKHIRNVENEDISYVEVAYGSDQTSFAGFHRFEVIHNDDKLEERAGASGRGNVGLNTDIKLSYSSLSCNPITNRPAAPHWVAVFHKFYGMRLFRDGVIKVCAAATLDQNYRHTD